MDVQNNFTLIEKQFYLPKSFSHVLKTILEYQFKFVIIINISDKYEGLEGEGGGEGIDESIDKNVN